MDPNELETKISEFEENLKARKATERGWSRHSEFLQLFPFREDPESIDDLTPEAVYSPGEKNYFFLWIEHKLKSLGHIGIGSAAVWENARANTDKLKELLRHAVNDSAPLSEKIDAHWEDIKGFGGDKHIAKKIIFCYYPREVIPIFKTEDLEHFAEKFDLDYRKAAYEKYGKDYSILSVGQRFELFNDLLFKLKQGHSKLKAWDSALFGRFLYTCFAPPKKPPTVVRHEVKPFSPYGLVSEPTYEQEVVFLFSKFHIELGFPIIVRIRDEFPDAEVFNNRKELKRVEFEVRASQFNHDPEACDYIVCWENDLTEEEIKRKKLPEIISLKEELEK